MRGKTGRVAARVRELLNQAAPPVEGASGPSTGPEGDGLTTGPGPRRAPWWRRLRARVPLRLDPGHRGAIAVGLAVLAAALVTGLWVMAARPRALAVSTSAAPIAGSSPVGTGAAMPVPASGRPPVSGAALSSQAALSATPTEVVVDVAGKVRHPGLYRLPVGARVDDALRAAGGELPGVDLSSLNLAARVVDGQQILVGILPPDGAVAPAPGGAPGAPPGTATGPVDLNSAGLVLLETLPGVGPVLGQHILDWRAAHSRFATVDQLLDVPGIGPAKFAALRGLVTV